MILFWIIIIIIIREMKFKYNYGTSSFVTLCLEFLMLLMFNV